MGANNISNDEREAIFGDFKWTRGSGDNIDIDQKWLSENIINVFIPQLKGVQTDGGKFNGNVKWNKKASAQLIAAWEEVEQSGLLHLVLTWDGSFAARVKRGGSTPSNHAYGGAFDINASLNWIGDRPAERGRKGDLHPLVPIFKTHGFYWGGDWKSPTDGMHFEIARIIEYNKPIPNAGDHIDKGPLLIINDDWHAAIKLDIVDGSSYVSAKSLEEASGGKWEGKDKMVPAGQMLASLGYRYTWNNEQKKLYAYK